MRPLRLQIENLTSFRGKQPVLDFTPFDLFAVSGKTGAGKSSLLDAVVLALYGRVPRLGARGAAEMISLGKDSLSVLLDFRVTDREYRVARRLYRGKRSATAQLEERRDGRYVLLAEKVRDVEERIEQILGLSFEAFNQAVLLPQGEFARFLKSDPRKRREILRDLLRLSVYERMREKASRRAIDLQALVKAREERLGVEGEGSSEEALAALAAELSGVSLSRLRAVEAAESGERAVRILRVQHRQTAELLAERTRERKLALEEGARTADRERVAAGRRAATVLPVLILLADAEARAAEEERRRRQLDLEVGRLAEEREASRRARSAAEEAADQVPGLEERMRELDRAAALLSERTAARRRRDGAQAEHGKALREHASASEAAAAASRRLADLSTAEAAARTAADAIDYDADGHARLEGLRDEAAALGMLRDGLVRAGQGVMKARDAVKKRENERAGLEREATAAARKLAKAEEKRQAAEMALREAESHDAALRLRAVLEPGAPCPVCDQTVARPPAAGKLEGSDKARGRYEKARAEEDELRALSARAEALRASGVAAADEARTASERLEREASEAAAVLAAREAELRQVLPPPVAEGPVEDVVRERLARLQQVAAQKRTALTAFDAARRALESAALEARGLVERRERAAFRIEELGGRLAEADAELLALESRLGGTGGAPDFDPARERERLAARVRGLKADLQAAREAESGAESAHVRVSTSFEETRTRSAAAARALASRRREADEALGPSGFVSEAEARAAALPPEQLAALEATLDGYWKERHALRVRIEELLAALAGVEVSDEALALEERRLSTLVEERETLARKETSLTERRAEAERRLQRTRELAASLETTRQEHAVYRQLADDLRSDRFQAYLLEETIAELVRGASSRLLALSGRYTFVFEDEAFHVLDHDNADEKRSAETLSGGETFLASLALALELSQQVQRAAGAVRLDSLFIDEGFGTLDPETLDTIAEAVESLPVGGRMVGVITHLPELTERLPVAIRVEKGPEGSRFSVVEN